LTAYIFSTLIGYAFGSFPTAYLLVKWKYNIDIRQAGSGNVGTMNVFEVTGSRMVGVTVLVLDMVKGTVPVLVVLKMVGNDFWLVAVAGLSAIIGHSFSAWLGFRGGRGLATTAGVMLVIGWVFVVIWIILWAGSYVPTKSIHGANILASVFSPLLIAAIPSAMLTETLPYYTSPTNLLLFGIVFCAVILVTHRKSILALFK
jgi:glycerol-3-phosphate acyltransferase PlsY